MIIHVNITWEWIFKVLFYITRCKKHISLARRLVSPWMLHEFEVWWLFWLGRYTFKIHEWWRIELSWIEWLGWNAPLNLLIMSVLKQLYHFALILTHMCFLLSLLDRYPAGNTSSDSNLLAPLCYTLLWCKWLPRLDNSMLIISQACLPFFTASRTIFG